MNEQSMHVVISIKSNVLRDILREHIDIVNKNNTGIKLNSDEVYIDVKENPYIVDVPSNDQAALKELLRVFKVLIGKECKPVIKAVKKTKNQILQEVQFDWSCIEVCIGELARDMSQISKEVPDLVEASYVDKYIFNREYKNKKYTQTEEAIYKDGYK